MAYVADVTDERSRGRGMGAMGAAMGLGFIFGPGVGGALSHFGHATPFLVAGGVNVATGLAAALMLRESLPRRKGGERPLAGFRMPAPWRSLSRPLAPFYLVAFSVPFAMAALETTFPLLLRDRLAMGAKEMGWMFLFMGTAVFVVQGFGLGRLINAFGEEQVLCGGLLLNAAGFLLVPAAAGRLSMTAALVLSGVGNQVMRPTNASLVSKRTAEGQGAAIGIMDSFDSLGRIMGPMLAGRVYGYDPRYPYFVSAAILLGCCLGLSIRGLIARRRRPSRTAAGR
jgi:MFS family permease